MFIKITPEGYTPDGKWRLVPVELTEEMEWAALSAGVQEASKERGIINRTNATYRTAIKAAPPPPAEMLVDAFDDDSGRKLFEAWVLRKVDDYNRLQPVRDKMLLRTAKGDYRQLWVDHSWEGWKAAIDAARGK